MTSVADVVNGDISSVAALAKRPGPDGISLREAMSAANVAPPGPRIYVLLSNALSGQTINVNSSLPAIRRDRITIVGAKSDQGRPAVTIDARNASSTAGLPGAAGVDHLFLLQASHVTIRDLRIAGIDWPSLGHAIWILPSPAQPISSIRIEDNVFDNTGFDFSRCEQPPCSGPRASGIEIQTTPSPSTVRVENVTVARNVFLNYRGDGHTVGVVLGGTGPVVENLVVRDNHFEGIDCCPVELGAHGGSGGRLSGARIVRNTFVGNSEAISLNVGASATVFDDTLIAGNVIAGSVKIPITVSAGNPLGGAMPTGNVIRNIRLVNNLLAPGSQNGIWIMGGAGPGVSGNRVDGVELRNNTVTNTSPAELFAVLPDLNGGAGNSITGIVVRNSIFWAPGNNFKGDVTPSIVQYSLTTMPGFAGVNGNISADPRFVSAQDFHLQAGSLAIDAGTSDGAPATDLEERARSRVDIGAYEFGVPLRPAARVSIEETGGTGTVTSTPTAISCPIDCRAAFDLNATVTLAAVPDAESRFLGWSGACSGQATCALNMDAAKAVSARFAARVPPRARCRVPRVVGKLLPGARRAIKRGNCSVGKIRRVRSKRARNRVLRQSPRPGAVLRARAQVNLVVGR